MTEPDLLAVVEQSPRAAAAHDRTGWVALFTDDGRVEDPVGSRPHVGPAKIGAFYDTFIAPRDIEFHRNLDIVGDSVVVRDVGLEVTMARGVTMRIPAFLRYHLREINGEWRFAVLQAYWELPAMMRQFLQHGPRAVVPGLRLSQALLRNQRLGGTVGFLTGFRRGTKRNKTHVAEFLNAAGSGEQGTAMHTLSPDVAVTFGETTPANIVEFVDALGSVTWEKMIGAGRSVVVSVGAGHERGVLFAEVNQRGDAITRIRYFRR